MADEKVRIQADAEEIDGVIAAVGALKMAYCGEIPASDSAEVMLENSSYIVLMSRADGGGLYIVHNGANAGISAISAISDVSLSVTDNTLSVANSGTAVRCAVIRFF